MFTRLQLRWQHVCLLVLLGLVAAYSAWPAWDHFLGRWAAYPPAADRFFTVLMTLATPLFCMILGFGVALLRPTDRRAWLLLAVLLGFGEAIRTNAVYTNRTDWWRVPATWYADLGENLWPVWLFLFLVYFPSRLDFDRRHPWLKWLWIAPMAVLAILVPLSRLGHPGARWLIGRASPVADASVLAFFATLFALFASRYRAVQNADERRRMRLLYWGTAISVGPALLLNITRVVLGRREWDFVPQLVTGAATTLICFFPLTLAYVIVVERAMDVRVVVRQGVQYALARNGVALLQILLAVGAILASVTLADTRQWDRTQRILIIAAGITAVFLLQHFAGQLRVWLDRRFFREAYRAEQVLSGLSDDVRILAGTGPLLETVARRLSDALHVPRVAILLRDGMDFRPALALGYEPAPVFVLKEDAPLVHTLRERQRPLLMDPAQMDGLHPLAPEVVLPLASRDRLLGLVGLGPKLSEEPYSASDLQLLASVAAQTGLALENSRLAEAIAAETAQRERLNRELEIAREVQQRLFPQTCPPVAGLEYAGACRPALGVGGDYYDFLALPEGRLGIAVGDVSGKGIPAALLMASLQSCLRGQVLAGTQDLTSLMRNINQLIYETSPANRYATFFYAQYDAAASTLTWVNAGHNPPLLFRGNDLISLAAGGPVIGLFGPAEYCQSTIALQAGDTIVAFTDGVSEAMNAADEEWGEDRLAEAVRACDGATPARTMIERIMSGADAFAAGAPQHDDMTLVVVRVLL